MREPSIDDRRGDLTVARLLEVQNRVWLELQSRPETRGAALKPQHAFDTVTPKGVTR